MGYSGQNPGEFYTYFITKYIPPSNHSNYCPYLVLIPNLVLFFKEKYREKKIVNSCNFNTIDNIVSYYIITLNFGFS